MFTVHENKVFFIKDRYVRVYELNTQRNSPLFSVRRMSSASGFTGYRGLQYNPAENSLLVTSDAEGGTYEMYTLTKDMAGV